MGDLYSEQYFVLSDTVMGTVLETNEEKFISSSEAARRQGDQSERINLPCPSSNHRNRNSQEANYQDNVNALPRHEDEMERHQNQISRNPAEGRREESWSDAISRSGLENRSNGG